jgi:hypothetical protein
VPWPQDEDKNPWWRLLADQDLSASGKPKMTVVGALPYGAREPIEKIHEKSLIIGRLDYVDSGEDRSFIVIEVMGELSRARAIDLLKAQNFTPLSIVTQLSPAGDSMTAHMVEVEGYVQDTDPRLTEVANMLADLNGKCIAIGGYPIPPVFRKGDTDPVTPASAKQKAAR